MMAMRANSKTNYVWILCLHLFCIGNVFSSQLWKVYIALQVLPYFILFYIFPQHHNIIFVLGWHSNHIFKVGVKVEPVLFSKRLCLNLLESVQDEKSSVEWLYYNFWAVWNRNWLIIIWFFVNSNITIVNKRIMDALNGTLLSSICIIGNWFSMNPSWKENSENCGSAIFTLIIHNTIKSSIIYSFPSLCKHFYWDWDSISESHRLSL